MEIINKRRSVRKFKKDGVISKDSLELLVKAAMQAPSAVNEQPWEFIIIDDKTILESLSEVSPHAKMLKDANGAIIVLANKNKVKSTLYPQDLAAATQNILLEATSLSIGSCWIGIYPKEDRMESISKFFKLDYHYEPFSIIALGILEDKNALCYIDRYNKDVIHYNGW